MRRQDALLRECRLAARQQIWFGLSLGLSMVAITLMLHLPVWDLGAFLLALLGAGTGMGRLGAARWSLLCAIFISSCLSGLLAIWLVLFQEGVTRFAGIAPRSLTAAVLLAIIGVFTIWLGLVIARLLRAVEDHPDSLPSVGFRVVIGGWIVACLFCGALVISIWHSWLVDQVHAVSEPSVAIDGRRYAVWTLMAGAPGRDRVAAVVVRPDAQPLPLQVFPRLRDGRLPLPTHGQPLPERSLVWWPADAAPVILATGLNAKDLGDAATVQALITSRREHLTGGASNTMP